MRLVFGTDHAGYPLSARLALWASAIGHTTIEVGADSEAPYDYPDAAAELVETIRNGLADLGVLCCGAGIGMSIAANRHHGIRAALCLTPAMASLARSHNHANVLCLGARLLTYEEGVAILGEFLETMPATDLRHVRRVEKIDERA